MNTSSLNQQRIKSFPANLMNDKDMNSVPEERVQILNKPNKKKKSKTKKNKNAAIIQLRQNMYYSPQNEMDYIPGRDTILIPGQRPGQMPGQMPSQMPLQTPLLQTPVQLTAIPGPIEYFDKSFEVKLDSILRYWATPIIGLSSIESLYKVKEELLKIEDKCSVINTKFPYLSSDERYKAHQNDICLFEIWISILSNVFFNKNICMLLIKGGKAAQYVTDKNITNDIDLVIIPFQPSPSDFIVRIGKNISQFLVWACSTESHSPFSVLGFNDSVPTTNKSIIKLSIKTAESSYLALLDISVGFNHFSPFIQWLYNNSMEKTVFFIDSIKINGMFIYQNLYHLIMEKIYYVIKYSSPTEIINMENTRFLRKSHPSLNNLLVKASIITSTKKEKLIEDYLTFILDFISKYENYSRVEYLDKSVLIDNINRSSLQDNPYEYYISK
jgi:hypothetical protein